MIHPKTFDTEKLFGYKIEIYPTEEQKAIIKRSIDVYRAIYNLGLEYEQKSYDTGNGFISKFELINQFTAMRRDDPNYSWMNDITVGSLQNAIFDLNKAFQSFFNKRTRYPKFKSRKRTKKSYSVRSDRCIPYERYISISGVGHVNAKAHRIPVGAKLYDTVITYDGYDRYYFSCLVIQEYIDMSEVEKSSPIGIDVGIRNMITTSDGDVFEFPDTKKYEKRMKRQQRRLQKYYNRYLEESFRTRTKYEDIPKSKNMVKKQKALHKTISKIHNKILNEVNVATKRIVDKNPECIVIETISVREQQIKSPWLLKHAPHMMYYTLHRQIQFKAKIRGIPVIKADTNYPSSQICSNCGNIRKTRHTIYNCPVCGLRLDRDINAAINLRNLAYQR